MSPVTAHTTYPTHVMLPGSADTVTPTHVTPREVTESAVSPVTVADRETTGLIAWNWGWNSLPTTQTQTDDGYKGKTWNMGK